MKIFRDGQAISIFFALWMSVAGTGLAFADTYVVEHVLSTQDENFAGGDDYGDYVINITNGLNGDPRLMCGGVSNPQSCFETVYANDPTHPVISVTAPTLPVDPSPRVGNVSSCAIPAAFEVIHEFCSNGHLFFFGSVLCAARWKWKEASWDCLMALIRCSII